MKFISSISFAAGLGPLLFIAAASKANPQVEPSIHKLCIEAKDYAGCVRAMKGDTSNTTRQIRSQGADIAEGNQCPSGFAYVVEAPAWRLNVSTTQQRVLALIPDMTNELQGKLIGDARDLFGMELE